MIIAAKAAGVASVMSLQSIWVISRSISPATYSSAGAVAYAGTEPASGARNSASRNSMAMVRSEEHTSELQSLMRISYAVFCLKKKKKTKKEQNNNIQK